MKKNASDNSYRWLGIATAAAVVFGAYFLRPFFTAVVFAAIIAYLFNPIYNRLERRTSKGTAASLTFVISVIAIVLPIVVVFSFSVLQINQLIDDLGAIQPADIGRFGHNMLNSVNQVLASIPGAHPISQEQLAEGIRNAAISLANGLLDFILSSVSGISSFITSFIIYIYVFLNFLTQKEYLVKLFKNLNPLGPSITGLYLDKAGAMTKAMVKGQFVIAFCQGFAEAILIHLAGIQGYFFFFLVILTVLSIIPLGGGVVAIPIGIGLLFTGNIWQGLLILVGHFVIITNIDNVLRPKLVPKNIRLNPALTLLAVFSGLAMFGFLGIVIGPVIIIIIKLTIEAFIESRSKTAHKI